jgi:hypothetical protein
LQALNLLDRALRATTDEELTAVVEALPDDHRTALGRLTDGGTSVESIREAAQHGRVNGVLENLAVVLTDACLAECITALGDDADHPSGAQLQAVLPDIVEHHGIGVTRLMLASTVAGEAPASAVIRDLLKHDELVALPRAVETATAPVVAKPAAGPERDAVLEARRERKERQRAEARARREQAERSRRGR